MMTTVQLIRPAINDLWAIAAAELSNEDRKNINFSCPDKLKILSDLSNLILQSKQECIKKKWRYTRKSGETVIFVDLFSKIAKWIDLFKQIGNTAVQYNPVHAALPWAGVRFLLQIAINDIDKFAFVVESATLIAEIICRYAIFEDVYLQSPSAATDELQRALVRFYASIMIYLSKVKSYFDQNTMLHRLKSGLLSTSNIESYFDAITTAQNTVDRCASMAEIKNQINQYRDLKRLLKCIDGPLVRMNNDLANLLDGFETSKRMEIRRWISPEPYNQHHEQAKREVLAGTGQWLLSDPLFNKWKKESVSSILWLHGPPGSGKSKLVSIVIEDAKTAFQNSHSPAPAFFYCSRNTAEPTRSNPTAIIASIVRQLSSSRPGRSLLPPIVSAYKKREIDGFASGSLGLDESCALVIQLAENYPITTIVIDALDECDPEKRAELFEALGSVLRESTSLVKIFVSSRDDQDIVRHLQDYPNLELSSGKIKDDIALFVREEASHLVQKGKLLRWSADKERLRTEIINKVTNDADGMFRWASLQLQSLCSLQTDEAIRERLGRLPPKLEELYLELYERLTATVANADRKIATNAFSWLLCARRTLKSQEFLAALSNTARGKVSKLTKEHVLYLCTNLVIYDRTLDIFRFAHLSVREFLEKRPEYDTATIHFLAAETSLLHVLGITDSKATKQFLANLLGDLPKPLGSSELSPYSTVFWASHCHLAAAQRTNGVLKELLYHFLSDKSSTQSAAVAWAKRVEYLDDYSIEYELRRKLQEIVTAPDVPLFVASCFDFQEIVSIRANFRDDVRNGEGKNALEVAATYGSCRVISEVIQDKEVRIEGRVVQAAAGNPGNGEEVMMLLLEQRGADVVITEEVVKAAAGNKRNGKEVMALLLKQRGADVIITEEVLKAAAGNEGNGKEVMMLLLEERGSDVVITEEVVKAAARNERNGREMMALLLKQRGADVIITEEVLKAAVGNEESAKEVIMLLLEQRGADVVITEDIVKAAAGNEDGKEVMMLLLEQRGADAVITEEVVKVAAKNRKIGKNVMSLLLQQRGADVVITEEVVKAAVGNEVIGREVMALLLKQRGADVVITEEVVKAAVGNYRLGGEVMMLLLEQRGADVVITEDVLILITKTCGKEVMMLLLAKRGKDVVITEEVVKAAAGNEMSGKEVMKLLLEQRGADVMITEEVVKAAARNWKSGKEILALLLEERGEEVRVAGNLSQEVVLSEANSFDEDVGSIASVSFVDSAYYSRGNAPQEIITTANENFLELFLADSDLCRLMEECLKRVTRDRFVRNVGRLIKKYCKGLQKEANKGPELSTVLLLRSQALRISMKIYEKCRLDDVSRVEAMESLSKQKVDRNRTLNDFLSQQENEAADKTNKRKSKDDQEGNDNIQTDNESIASDSNRSSGSEYSIRGQENNEISMIESIKDFLTTGAPYRELLRDLHLWLDPKESTSLLKQHSFLHQKSKALEYMPLGRQERLRSLIAQVAFSPLEHIKSVDILMKSRQTGVDRFRSLLERHTKQPWNWWPLQPLHNRISEDQVRLAWKCACDLTRYVDVSREGVESHLNSVSSKSAFQAKGMIASQSAPQSVISASGVQSAPSSLPPAALVSHTQGDSPSSIQASAQHDSSGHFPTFRPRSSALNSEHSNDSRIPMPQNEHVLFGINLGNKLSLSQIKKVEFSDDGKFFAQLRQEYNARRGFLRRWLALGQFHHCEFVEFEKPCYQRIFRRGKGYPHDIPQNLTIYRYRPGHKESEWRDPPILEHEFYERFYGCSNCMVAGHYHKCSHYCPATIDRLERIPKRIQPFSLESQGQEEAWGLHAVEYICTIRVLFYHLVALLGPLIFWGLWLWYWGHDADLQNASVPFFSMITLLSLFWALVKG